MRRSRQPKHSNPLIKQLFGGMFRLAFLLMIFLGSVQRLCHITFGRSRKLIAKTNFTMTRGSSSDDERLEMGLDLICQVTRLFHSPSLTHSLMFAVAAADVNKRNARFQMSDKNINLPNRRTFEMCLSWLKLKN